MYSTLRVPSWLHRSSFPVDATQLGAIALVCYGNIWRIDLTSTQLIIAIDTREKIVDIPNAFTIADSANSFFHHERPKASEICCFSESF